MTITFENKSNQQKGRFPLKLATGTYHTDSNFETVYLNVAEVNRLVKSFIKQRVSREKLANFKNIATVRLIRGKYWAISHAVA